MKDNQNKAKSVTRLTAFTVKQLSELFGKSEDTIRRWKNEGVGKGEDNIKLRAVENEDEFGHRTSRHLVFTRSAVRDFVQANPFLMDDAPQLREFMEQKTKKPEVFALPDSVETSRRSIAWQDGEEYELDMEDDVPEIPKSFFDEDEADDEYEEPEDDFLNRFLRGIRRGSKRRARPDPELEFFDEDEDEDEDDFSGFRSRPGRRPGADDSEEDEYYERVHRDIPTYNYIIGLLHERETRCENELSRNRSARMHLFGKFGERIQEHHIYLDQLLGEKDEELRNEIDKIREISQLLQKLI